jgi:AcrR family transcriptional regulator
VKSAKVATRPGRAKRVKREEPSVLERWREQVGHQPTSPRGRRSREQLLVAAREIFARDGFQAARITDIAERAGVSHGTFYTYFDSKDLIFRALILQLQDDLLGREARAADEPELDPIASIERTNRRFLRAYERNHDLTLVWHQVAAIDPEVAAALTEAKQPFFARTQRAIIKYQEQGIADPRIDPVYGSHAIASMVTEFAYSWFSQRQDFEFDKVVEQLSLLCANAMGLGHLKDN